jgi:hypothetical protein
MNLGFSRVETLVLVGLEIGVNFVSSFVMPSRLMILHEEGQSDRRRRFSDLYKGHLIDNIPYSSHPD